MESSIAVAMLMPPMIPAGMAAPLKLSAKSSMHSENQEHYAVTVTCAVAE